MEVAVIMGWMGLRPIPYPFRSRRAGPMNLFAFREPISAWSHGTWLVLALPATIWLWRRGGADLAKKLSLLIFGSCASFCFGASMLYHGARVPDRYLRAFELADYIGIYLMIAGTVTPVA